MQRRQFIASGVGMLAYAGAGTVLAGQGAGGQFNADGYSAMLNQSFNIYDRVRGIGAVGQGEDGARPGRGPIHAQFTR